MVRKLLFFHMLLYSLLFLINQSVLAEVTAETNRTVISIDETLMLRIVQSNGADGEPDLSVLKNDFQILDQSQSQSFSFINGRSSNSHTWTITLLANNTGEAMIPAIPVGKESTRPIKIFIKKPSETPAQDGKEVFVEVSITPDEGVYVQQQVLLTVSLFHRARFTNASLSEPEIQNAVVERVGKESSYQKLLGQYNYNVIERRYAIYPQQSGQLQIPGIVFSGNLEQQSKGSFSIFSRLGKRVISRTEPVILKVLPIPDSYTGKTWLPAKHLTIEADILEDEQSLKAGEAITRRIAVSAVGLIASQLPAINLPASNDYKTYPDKESIDSQLIGDEIVGTRQDSMAIIPVHAGKITLPEVKIDWWNTQTQEQASTVLPAKVLSIAKNPQMPDLPPAASSTAKQKQVGQTKPNLDNKPVKLSNRQADSLMNNHWFWISMVLVMLWLATLGLLLLKRKKPRTETGITQKPASSSAQIHKRLKQSCADNDPLKATQLMVSWARLYFDDPTISGLAQLLELIEDQDLVNEINQLEQSRYAAVKQNWSGEALCQSLEKYINQQKAALDQQHQQYTLAPLNPT